ncbi:hypothetical protein IMX07_04645 [bacterium]|nr:hypothetical protein [bacterium]
MRQGRGRALMAGLLCGVLIFALSGAAGASTYAVYIPLDSSIYNELETLNGLGYLQTYLDEIKPISRVEAARLTLEAGRNLEQSRRSDPLARSLIRTLRDQLSVEVGWLENDQEDNPPTMFRPVQRIEAQYLFSRGDPRQWRTSATNTPNDSGINATEATPLLPSNDGLPTAPGSNEIVRWSGWGGVSGFLAGYGEGSIAGPMTRSIKGVERLQLLGTGVVASFGNLALSVGTEEMWWGTGHFDALSQSDNSSPFPAVRVQSIHPLLLPWIFRYLGQFRYQLFFGQLDGERYFAHPWIDGQIFSFKPLPTFEFGFTHAIMFGGLHNNNYNFMGFLGRASALATGNPVGANTNSRAGIYLKFYFPSLRNLEVYQEILGEDNLTKELPPIGRFLPFLAVSYQGGFYLPRLTRDGMTDLRFEYALLEPNYSTHGDSLYWTYESQLMGDAMGPNATEVDIQAGRWLDLRDKLSADVFYTEQAPGYATAVAYPYEFYPYPLGKEHSGGVAFDFLRLPAPMRKLDGGLATLRARGAVEYVRALNYQAGASSVRFLLMCSLSFTPGWTGWTW